MNDKSQQKNRNEIRWRKTEYEVKKKKVPKNRKKNRNDKLPWTNRKTRQRKKKAGEVSELDIKKNHKRQKKKR